MDQVLFRFRIPGMQQDGIPLYGFGLMLCIAFAICTWLAGRRAQKEGIAKEFIQDLAIWLLVGGVVGARLASVILDGVPIWQFFKIWDGGLVFYGSAIGGLAGYFLAYIFVIRRQGVSTWKLADIIAPSVAMGLCLGRIGCLLNGCCYGSVDSCPDCYALHFPLSSPPRYALVDRGYQTAAGFTVDDSNPEVARVRLVEPNSAAAQAGLQPGDHVIAIRDFEANGKSRSVQTLADLENAFGRDWTRGKNSLALTVRRGTQEIDLSAYQPRTLGLYPTQLYESISMLLLFCVLTAYFPFRRRPGEVMALLMVGYGIHRSMNELLRDDPRPVGFEKYISLVLIVIGIGLWIWLRRTAAQDRPMPKSA